MLLAARDRYLREIWRTCVDTWPFSIAAQFVGFRFVPSHLLIPYVTCCSFVFTGLVSGLQGKFRLAERQGVALPPPEAPLPLPTILAEESRSSLVKPLVAELASPSCRPFPSPRRPSRVTLSRRSDGVSERERHELRLKDPYPSGFHRRRRRTGSAADRPAPASFEIAPEGVPEFLESKVVEA